MAEEEKKEIKEEQTIKEEKPVVKGTKSPMSPQKESAAKEETEKTAKIKKAKEYEAIVNIYTSFNNTIVHVTDMSGKTLAKVTGGMVTKHGRLKANPTTAMFIAKKVAENIKDLKIKLLYFRIRAKTRNPAPGPGAHAIIKSLSREGFKIANILDVTKFPRGGPRQKGGRRGRRP